MKEKLRSEKKYKPEVEYKKFVWGTVRTFKKSIKIQQRNCIKFIKKVVRGWFK